MRLCVYIAFLFPLFLVAGARSSIVEMAPPISRLALASLQDTFEEIYNGQPHEAIDILEPIGTPAQLPQSNFQTLRIGWTRFADG